MAPAANNSRPAWATETQPDPPNFGRARLIPRWWLDWIVRRRRRKVRPIIERAKESPDFEPGLVSIVILSCQRPDELKRLVHSLSTFLDEVEDCKKIETILVDNGSGPELLQWAEDSGFFTRIIAHEKNLGMAVALDHAFPTCRGEFILLLEEDFIVKYDRPFLKRCLTLFAEYPEIGIIRLKNQNNWGKPFRIIGPRRDTSDATSFWTWLPSRNGSLNVWAAGSVLFRKVSFTATGPIPVGANVGREKPHHQGVIYELHYGKRYNKTWLAAKIKDCYPFIQPNDNPESPGWGEINSAEQ